jgi:hypothetical protein
MRNTYRISHKQFVEVNEGVLKPTRTLDIITQAILLAFSALKD